MYTYNLTTITSLIASSAGTAVEHEKTLHFLLLFGVAILAGTVGSRFFQKLHIPRVVGFIVVGILLGDILGIITEPVIDGVKPFTMFALGLIGFMIGGELRGEVFKKYGKHFFFILLSEGIGAFLLVGIGTTIAAWFALPYLMPTEFVEAERLSSCAALGLVLGAIASATAPAATVNVLWEYKTKGPLTTTILAIVALDDALALILYKAATSAVKAITGIAHSSLLIATGLLAAEIVASILLGIAAGVLFFLLIKYVSRKERTVEFAVALLLVVVGTSIVFEIDPILPSMILGVTVANLMPRQSKGIFQTVEGLAPPVYVLFFVLAGSHLELKEIGWWLLLMVAVYLLFRTGGKFLGSWFGARASKAPKPVQNYLGLCLLSQAGVAIGLAVISKDLFQSHIGHAVIVIIMTSTFVVEIVGPLFVKLGVKKAGEVGLNITEEDLIETYKVKDVMDTKVPGISSGLLLRNIIEIVSNTDKFYYPVTDNNNKVIGVITLDGIRNTFATQELNDWLVALDLMQPIIAKVTPEVPLSDALEIAGAHETEYLPVVASPDDNKFTGVLDIPALRRWLSAEVLLRQQKADNIPETVRG